MQEQQQAMKQALEEWRRHQDAAYAAEPNFPIQAWKFKRGQTEMELGVFKMPYSYAPPNLPETRDRMMPRAGFRIRF